jgi:hypothetical protein
VLSLMVAVASVAGWLLRDLTTDCVAAIRTATEAAPSKPLDLTVDVTDPHPAAAAAGRTAVSPVAIRTRPSSVTQISGADRPPTTRLVTTPIAVPQAVVIHDTQARDATPSIFSPVTATGDHIVIASDGSIVSVGDNTVVKGNTGNAGSSGAISVDVNGSTIDTGSSSNHGQQGSTSVPSSQNPGTRTAERGEDRASASTRPTSGSAQCTPLRTGASPGARAVAIAGWENRALDVAGSDNVLTYDDSAVFVQRVGAINANTGNTDSSGVNTVDAVDSRIRTGSSASSRDDAFSSPSDPAFAAAGCASGGGGASVIDGSGITTALADDSFVIGGDGVHDRSVRTRGDRNVTTSGDGTTTIGGVGNVNAQIGDSSTSGAVVMGVRSSDIASGDSSQLTSDPTHAETGGS